MKETIDGQFNRLEQIPDMVRTIAYDNVLVNHVLKSYIYGDIITKEECLCRMIVELSKNWQDEQRRAYETLRLVIPPP